MTVATRSPQRAGEVAGPQPQSVLAQASFTVDEHPERFIELVRAASVEELKPVAPRLLELLSSKAFGLQQVEGATPRQVTVQAVLRAGYPWALELEPEDVAFVHEQEAAARSAWRRSLLRRSVPLALVLVGVGFVVNGFVRVVSARSSENPVSAPPRSVALLPPRSKPVAPDLRLPTLDELVPEADRAALLSVASDRLVADGREVEALGVALDCLALRGADEGRCALAADRAVAAMARRDGHEMLRLPGGSTATRADSEPAGGADEPLEGAARADDQVSARTLSDQLFVFSEAPHAAAVRRETRAVMGTLRELARGEVVSSSRSESMAREAQARFARGEFMAALNVAERCVAFLPPDADCLAVAATALPLVQAARPGADRIAHKAAVAEQLEGYRRQMARALAHDARERCEARPPGTDESRPIACP